MTSFLLSGNFSSKTFLCNFRCWGRRQVLLDPIDGDFRVLIVKQATHQRPNRVHFAFKAVHLMNCLFDDYEFAAWEVFDREKILVVTAKLVHVYHHHVRPTIQCARNVSLMLADKLKQFEA